MDWRATVAAVDDALKSCAALAEQTGPGEWDFTVTNGGALLGHAQLMEEWLVLDLPCGGALEAAQAWNLLRFNSKLSGQAKFGLRRRAVHLRAEIPIIEETDLALRLTDTYRAFEQGLALACGESSPAGAEASPGRCAPVSTELGRLLEEAGWPGVQRDPNRYAVELEVGGRGYHQALIEAGEGGLRIAAELVRWREAARESREALAVFLLATNWAVRLVRGAGEDGAETRAWFEVAYQAPPNPEELSRALGALSVACRLSSREAAALEDSELARRYLEFQQF